jgi:hypothetical protein
MFLLAIFWFWRNGEVQIVQNNLENHIAPEIGPLCMPNRAQLGEGVFSVS